MLSAVLRWGVTLTGTAALLSGCSNDSTAEGSRLPGPGTPIVEGVVVAEGSRLIGLVPDDERNGHIAMLLVDDDPAEVFDRYVTQLAAVGFGMRDLERTRPSDCHPEVDSYRAWASQGEASAEMQLLWTNSDEDQYWAQHLVLRLNGPVTAGGPVSVDLEEVGPDPGVLDGPTDPPPLPEPGERVATQRHLDPTDELVVVEGSELLAPPVTNCGVTGGMYVVVTITGDPRGVVDRYLDVVHAPTVTVTDRPNLEGQRVIQGSGGGAGGPDLTVTAVPDADGRWTALLDMGND